MSEPLYSEKLRNEIIRKSYLKKFVTPDYDKYCITNLPRTILSEFNIKVKSQKSIDDKSLKNIINGKTKFIILVIDSLSYNQFLKAIKSKYLNFKIPQRSILLPITSTFPSTTSTAMTSLNTGLEPAQHGILGYFMYLREFRLIANMVRLSPLTEDGKILENNKIIDPLAVMRFPTIYEILLKKGINSYVMLRRDLHESSFTKMIHKGAKIIPYIAFSDLMVNLRKLIESRISKKSLIFCYWDLLDTISHIYGPESEESSVEIYNILNLFKKILLQPVNRNIGKETVVLLTSDHGHHTLMQKRTIITTEYHEISENLLIPPTGSSRALYLHSKNGRINLIKNIFKTNFNDSFFIINSIEANKMGLFGSRKSSIISNDKIGDLIVLPYKGYSIVYPYKSGNIHFLKGGHGGLSQEEMLVPLLCVDLGKS